MRDPFADSRAKLNRGKEKLGCLYAEVLDALDADPVEADVEFNAQRPVPAMLPDGRPLTIAVIYVTRAPTIPRHSGLLVGEVLHNFRSSLDHLAWALVKHAGQRKLTAAQARHIAFPMVRKRDTLKSNWNSALRGVPKSPYLAIIDHFQPYRRTAAGRAMRTLRNLSDTDKHRLLIPGAAFPYEGNLEIKVQPSSALVGHKELIALHRPVAVGMKLISLLLIAQPPGQLRVQADGNFQTYPELPGRLPMEATLNAIRDACAACINQIAATLL